MNVLQDVAEEQELLRIKALCKAASHQAFKLEDYYMAVEQLLFHREAVKTAANDKHQIHGVQLVQSWGWHDTPAREATPTRNLPEGFRALCVPEWTDLTPLRVHCETNCHLHPSSRYLARFNHS